MRTLYAALGLPSGADQQQIKTAYRSLARRFHPDVNAGDSASAARLAEINRAYATLGNPEARAAYDRDLAQRRADARRRYAAFAAMSVAIFAVTAGSVSLVVQWHLRPAPGPAVSAQGDTLLSPPARGWTPSALPAAGAGPAPHSARGASWTTYRNPRFDYALRYPAGIFVFDAAQSDANVHTFISRDGRAVLRIVLAQSTAGIKLADFRSALIRKRYTGASFDQTPRRRHWFALVGTRGDEVFLERVTFSCDGKWMHGWQMRYPKSQRAAYDALAKLILRNYPHGNGPGAGCRNARPEPRARQQSRRKRG